MVYSNTPPWSDALTIDQIKAIGFTDPVNVSDTDRYRTIAQISDGQYGSYKLRYYPDDPMHVFLAHIDNPEWLILPLQPLPAALHQAVDYYITPGKTYAKQFEGIGFPALALAARKATGIVQAPENTKKLRYFIGFSDNFDEVMTNLEDRLTLNPWCQPNMPTQATATGGLCTQVYTVDSLALLTFKGEQAPNGYFALTLEIAYKPSFHEKYTQSIISRHLKAKPYASLPIDVPLDLIGLIFTQDFQALMSQEDLLSALDSEPAWLQALCMFVSDSDFEHIFSELVKRTSLDQNDRDLVAYEAIFRANRTIYDLIAAQGLSQATIKTAKERLGWEPISAAK